MGVYCVKYLTLRQVYKKPSPRKEEIFRNCCIYARKFDAVKMGIISYNIFKFTFAFETPDGNILTIYPNTYPSILNEL